MTRSSCSTWTPSSRCAPRAGSAFSGPNGEAEGSTPSLGTLVMAESKNKRRGETQMRMTLDRIDNNLGHIVSNVLGACLRCNYMRRDMPFGAWQKIVPTIKQIRCDGLFGEWTGAPYRVRAKQGTPSR